MKDDPTANSETMISSRLEVPVETEDRSIVAVEREGDEGKSSVTGTTEGAHKQQTFFGEVVARVSMASVSM